MTLCTRGRLRRLSLACFRILFVIGTKYLRVKYKEEFLMFIFFAVNLFLICFIFGQLWVRNGYLIILYHLIQFDGSQVTGPPGRNVTRVLGHRSP